MRINETQLSEVSAVGQSQNSDQPDQAGAVSNTSLIKMQHLEIEKKELSDMIIDASNKGEQIQEDALEFNEITKRENGPRMPTECGGELRKFQQYFDNFKVTIPNEKAVIK